MSTGIVSLSFGGCRFYRRCFWLCQAAFHLCDAATRAPAQEGVAVARACRKARGPPGHLPLFFLKHLSWRINPDLGAL